MPYVDTIENSNGILVPILNIYMILDFYVFIYSNIGIETWMPRHFSFNHLEAM